MTQIVRAALVALVATTLAACPSETNAPLTIALDQSAVSVMVGQTAQLSATLSGDASDMSIDWSSANNSIATVSTSGTVTGTGPGTTQITASAVADPSKTAVATVTVTAPNMSLSVSPATLGVVAGQIATAQVTLSREGFTGLVEFSAQGMPNGVGATFTPSTVIGSDNVTTLTIVTAPGTIAGSYTLTIRGTANGLTPITTTLALTVTSSSSGGSGGIALDASPTSLTVTAGQSGTSQITLTRSGGFTGTVTLAAENLPANVTASFNPATLSGVTTTSTLTVTAASGAAAGSSPVTIRGTGTGVTSAIATLALTIAAAAPTSFVASSVDAGDFSVCALTIAGQAYCWGNNLSGTFGNGQAGQGLVATAPQPTSGNLTFSSISVGQNNTCALTPSGAAYCWGRNTSGAIGNGTLTESLTPTPVSGGLSFSSISVGHNFACALALDQKAYCWGGGSAAGAGDPANAGSTTPAAVAGGHLWTQIVAGPLHTCGVTTTGAAYCWGQAIDGELLGYSSNRVEQFAPVQMMASSGHTFKAVGAGEDWSCALTTAGAVYCWGTVFGYIGAGGQNRLVSPTLVSGSVVLESLVVGWQHGCGLTSAGAAYCWGFDHVGATGTGAYANRASATAVVGGAPFKKISAGGNSCAIALTGGALYCWGGDDTGGHGDGAPQREGYVPGLVSPPPP